jgi:hypothetical protein
MDSISARNKSEICVRCAASARPHVLSTGDHPLKFGQDDVDRYAVVRFCNTRSSIASGCFDPKPDQLPWRGHPVHDRQQSI